MSAQAVAWALASTSAGVSRHLLLVLALHADAAGRIEPWNAEAVRRDMRIRRPKLLATLAALEDRSEIFAEGTSDHIKAVIVAPSRTCMRTRARSGNPTGFNSTRGITAPLVVTGTNQEHWVNANLVVTGTRLFNPLSPPLTSRIHRYSEQADDLAHELWDHHLPARKPMGGFVAFRERVNEALIAGYTADDLRAIAPTQGVWTRAAMELSFARRAARPEANGSRQPRYYDPDEADPNWREKAR